MGKCPLAARSEHEIRHYLESVPFYSLVDHHRDVLSLLTECEYTSYAQEFFVHYYSDIHGRIAHILYLIEQNIIVAVGIPLNYRQDEKMRRWFDFFRRADDAFPGEVYHQDELETEALTDALIGGNDSEFSISDPRWEHVDQNKAANDPEHASCADHIKLMATVEGVVNGAGVDFTVYKTVDQKEQVIANVHGRNQNGHAEVEWTIPDDIDVNTDALSFAAEVRSRQTQRRDIALLKETIVGKCVDISNNPFEDVPFSVLVDGEVVYEGVSDSNGELKAPVEEGQEFEILLYGEVKDSE